MHCPKNSVILRVDVIAEESKQEVRIVITGSERLCALTHIHVIGTVCGDLTRLAHELSRRHGIPFEEFMKAGRDGGREVL